MSNVAQKPATPVKPVIFTARLAGMPEPGLRPVTAVAKPPVPRPARPVLPVKPVRQAAVVTAKPVTTTMKPKAVQSTPLKPVSTPVQSVFIAEKPTDTATEPKKPTLRTFAQHKSRLVGSAGSGDTANLLSRDCVSILTGVELTKHLTCRA